MIHFKLIFHYKYVTDSLLILKQGQKEIVAVEALVSSRKSGRNYTGAFHSFISFKRGFTEVVVTRVVRLREWSGFLLGPFRTLLLIERIIGKIN